MLIALPSYATAVAYDAIAVGSYAIAIIIVCHVQNHCMPMVKGSDAIARRV